MSKQPNQSNAPHRVLPPPAVDRVFARLVAIYGVQAVAAKYDGIDPAERGATWGSALGRASWVEHRQSCDLKAIGEALEQLATDGGAWPPALPELVDRVERVMQRPGRNHLALPMPRRTPEEIERGRQRMDELKALLARRPSRTAPTREPGSDDEPAPGSAACTCWVGLLRAETLCPSCSGWLRNRQAVRYAADGTAPAIADQLRDAA